MLVIHRNIDIQRQTPRNHTMLETAPQLEQELDELLNNYVESAVSTFSPAMSQIDRHRVFEGHRNLMLRETGEVDETDIRQISGEAELKVETIMYGTIQEILETFLPAAESMASSQMQMLIDILKETTEKTGNKVEGNGQPLSFDLILETLEKLEIAFDREGNPKMPTMMGHPDLRARLEALAEDPGRPKFEERQKKLIDRKRLEWRAREANRTLVG